MLARIRVHLANARLTQSARAALDVSGRYLLAVSGQGKILWATPQAQKMSREIPPCMAMGQAAGFAAALAADRGVAPREVPAADIQRMMRKAGADPGDVPSANADQVEFSEVEEDHS